MPIDYDILDKCKNGIIVTPDIQKRVDRAASVGMMHTGTHVEIVDKDQRITIQPTARTTKLGMGVLNSEYTLWYRIKNTLISYVKR